MTDERPKPAGRRVLSVSADLFCDLFTAGSHPGYSVTADALPDDARVVDAQWNGFGDVIDVLVESAAWPPTEPGHRRDSVNPMLTRAEPAEARVRALIAAGDNLSRWAHHGPACWVTIGGPGDGRCTCGVSEHASAWKKAKEGQA